MIRIILDSNVSAITIFIQDNSIGDYSSIIALIITILGFGITLIQLTKTKNSSQIAVNAVNAMRNDLKIVDIVTNLSSVVIEMEEIKRLHREKNTYNYQRNMQNLELL